MHKTTMQKQILHSIVSGSITSHISLSKMFATTSTTTCHHRRQLFMHSSERSTDIAFWGQY